MYHELLGLDGGVVPGLADGDGLATYRALHRAIADSLVVAIHDCSEGGLAVALAEFAIAGAVGLDVSLPGERDRDAGRAAALGTAELLFSESSGRFVVQATAGAEAELVARLAGLTPVFDLGTVQPAPAGPGTTAVGAEQDPPRPGLRVRRDGEPVLFVPLAELRAAFRAPFPPTLAAQ
jgi:phosphoribosylformylglycinamidine synthase